MTVEEAEIELQGIVNRLELDEDSALYVLMKEYNRLKTNKED